VLWTRNKKSAADVIDILSSSSLSIVLHGLMELHVSHCICSLLCTMCLVVMLDGWGSLSLSISFQLMIVM